MLRAHAENLHSRRFPDDSRLRTWRRRWARGFIVLGRREHSSSLRRREPRHAVAGASRARSRWRRTAWRIHPSRCGRHRRGGGVRGPRCGRRDGGGEVQLHPHLRTNDALVRRFQREAALLSPVNHPGIVPILSTGTDGDDLPFLVMPLLRGETLEELRLARGGTLPVPEAAGYTLALLDVLAAVHAAGVVHRDVSLPTCFARRAAAFGSGLRDWRVVSPRETTTTTGSTTTPSPSPRMASSWARWPSWRRNRPPGGGATWGRAVICSRWVRR